MSSNRWRMMSSNSSMSMNDGIEWDETFHFQVLQEQYHAVSEDSMEAEAEEDNNNNNNNSEIEIEVVPPSSLLHMKRPLIVVSPSDSFPPSPLEERETPFALSDSRESAANVVAASPLLLREQNERTLKKKQKMGKRVHFGDNEICVSNMILEEENCHELWWTDMERQAIVNREELLAKAECHQETAKGLAELWKGCSSLSDDYGKQKTDLLVLCQSDSRGLEDDLLPDMQQYQENAVRSILKAQERWRKEESMDPQLLGSRLKEQYEELSRTAQVFARALGEGDALAVHSWNFTGTRLFI